MGLKIDMGACDVGMPRLVLSCDGAGLFHSKPFESTKSYPDARRDAAAEGWLERFVDRAPSRDEARIFLGPCCSGKAPR